MCISELKKMAAKLPLLPGVYLMKDRSGKVVYVGKAKKLRNRVSQYFVDTVSHSAKTRAMVSKIDHFEVIIADTEFEALVLECSLIKQHSPKYNILLKDDKGYPFVRLDRREAYPVISVVNNISKDGAEYFGPFGSRGVTKALLKSINLALKLPDCNRKFPRDIGKERPCLNYHMDMCEGWCLADQSQESYKYAIEDARSLLLGNYKTVATQIRKRMVAASDALNFELAAALRNQLQSVEALGKRQLVTAAMATDTDVIGYAQTEIKACFSVLHFSDGNLLDKESVVFPTPEEGSVAVSSLVKQFYLSRQCAPKKILLPFDIDDRELIQQLLSQEGKTKVAIHVPQRGNNAQLVALAVKNAQDEADRATDRDEKNRSVLTTLGKMLSIASPERIESFDISNIAGTDIVAGMVVFSKGRPSPGSYKRFKIKGLVDQDDYACMAQVVRRRLERYLENSKGFEVLPDLFLIDGGASHVKVVSGVLRELQIDVPAFGMVKDDRHRTRALIRSDGAEIRIDNNVAVFSFIGNIQEETHRFAIGYHRKLRSKRLQYSELDHIPGIGPKRKHLLLKSFESLSGIAAAGIDELQRTLPKDAAMAVYMHFQEKKVIRNASDRREKPGDNT